MKYKLTWATILFIFSSLFLGASFAAEGDAVSLEEQYQAFLLGPPPLSPEDAVKAVLNANPDLTLESIAVFFTYVYENTSGDDQVSIVALAETLTLTLSEGGVFGFVDPAADDAPVGTTGTTGGGLGNSG